MASPPSPAPAPHEHRHVAESFGVDPERYDRTRPPYPDELIARIAESASDIVDVGCGTGIEGRQLRAAGCRVLGVEPDERMAEVARRSGIEVEHARFEDWDPAGRTFDAVVAGQAWHWVDPLAGATKAADVLRPGGLLAVFWHVFELPEAVAEAFATAFHAAVPDSPFDFRSLGSALDAYQAMFDMAADGIRRAGRFGEPDEWRYAWARSYTRDEWLDQLPTQGALTRVEPTAQATILRDVGEAIDGLGGQVEMAYTTVAVAAVRQPDSARRAAGH